MKRIIRDIKEIKADDIPDCLKPILSRFDNKQGEITDCAGAEEVFPVKINNHTQ